MPTVGPGAVLGGVRSMPPHGVVDFFPEHGSAFVGDEAFGQEVFTPPIHFATLAREASGFHRGSRG